MIVLSSVANLRMWTVTCGGCGMRTEKFSASDAERVEQEHGLLHREEEAA